jgi:hypothetical protein
MAPSSTILTDRVTEHRECKIDASAASATSALKAVMGHQHARLAIAVPDTWHSTLRREPWCFCYAIVVPAGHGEGSSTPGR